MTLEWQAVATALKAVQDAIRLIPCQLAELEQLRQDAVSLRAVDYSTTRVSGTSASDVGDAVAVLMEAEKNMADVVATRLKVKERTRALVHKVPREEGSPVLIELIIHGRSRKGAAAALNYHPVSIHRGRRRAVQYIADHEELARELCEIVAML